MIKKTQILLILNNKIYYKFQKILNNIQITIFKEIINSKKIENIYLS